MTGLREFFNTSRGKAIVMGFLIIAAAVAVYSAVRFFGGSDAVRLSRGGVFIDAATAKPFSYTIEVGTTIPVPAPSGKNTGYPAEMCYWTKDGKTKRDPTPVLLNRYAGKPEPTFCPDCGRLVVQMNPPALSNAPPPPTEPEYRQRRTPGGAGGTTARPE